MIDSMYIYCSGHDKKDLKNIFIGLYPLTLALFGRDFATSILTLSEERSVVIS